MVEKNTFEEVHLALKKMQKEFNSDVKSLLNSCDENIIVNVAPTYLSHVDPKDGYPIQLIVDKESENKRAIQPVFGGIL